MKFHIPAGVGPKLARHTLVAQKHSPTIFFVAGIAGTIASTALACRATLKLEGVIDQADSDLRTAVQVRQTSPEEYSEADFESDRKVIRVRTIAGIVKLYAPSAAVGALAIAALSHSHNTLTRRNAALGAAYAAIDTAYREYRQRVVDQYGEEKDRELRFGVEKVSVVDETTGRRKNVMRVASDARADYARFFDDSNPNWHENQETVALFLWAQQNRLNDYLKAHGFLLLNDAYDALGMPKTSDGAVVGWVIDGSEVSDNYVDFGIFGEADMNIVDFVKGQGDQILVDFNVDGLVYDLIDAKNQEVAKWQS